MACKHGGGTNHRMGLYDMIMIKDNHIVAAGGIENAINQSYAFLKNSNLLKKIPIEIETRTLDEVKAVVKYGKDKIDRIMLDNMVSIDEKTQEVHVKMLEEALKIVNHQFETEASGNINMLSIEKVGKTNVDYVSIGSLTHSVKALDISLKFETE